ncbi:murein L,D-transpeptidase YcbB/YkuD [Rhodopseudomonas thermotolerans]|uniref:Murein L,D-transpeptidase YcbB/YkuD n=2 Tax=Rhodopseudomonas TaxID=1073 RepID=A0A336JWZ0_9BRAD|nr:MULTISPECIES: L,D-transpeptidase family protein [Rhodopseudomonas]RED30285.1 murein L,D-transpeptidase YcbB/YkuD [Rhodopseudomonas pentothenatexigens]REF92499.1 murein L,D-transpeptidase YcbB/YkuD [Rhodopseudomonas thermotolerans]SSW92154.1 murein L,D-transpeptidase YcbB/YkuD [Rhodopseudomonas pentothenatexigens]
MRDHSTGRRGFEGVLMAVAATFLTVSATSAPAQSPTRSPADLAIDAAVPVPTPVDLPPPSIGDFKLDSAPPSVTDPTKNAAAPAKAEDRKDATAAAPSAAGPSNDTAATTPATDAPKTEAPPATAAAPAAEPAKPATEQAASPKPAEPQQPVSKVAAADQPVADQLRDLLAKSASRYFERKVERSAVEKFYEARDYAPVWTSAGALTAPAKGVIARLKDAAADGLDPDDYPVPNFTAATSPETLAEAELRLTESMMDYARQAQSGRMHWSQVSGDIQYPEHPIDPAQVLAKVTTAADASAALDSYNPPHKLYRELKKKLAELRGEGDRPVVKIAEGATLRYVPAQKRRAEATMDDPRVPQLRARLGVTENADSTAYDATVAEAVLKFQHSAGLNADGVLGDRTVQAMNTPKRDRAIDTIIVNMERWRWLPRDLGVPALGDAYVILNIPDYTLKVMQHGAEVWSTRVVVGKPGKHATPLLTETMKYITVNPTWNVPPSIIYNEYLPALQQDPTVLDRMGLKLSRNRDGSIHISQPPGEANALGRIRFNFPNKFLVYQHDTPDKNLFGRDERAYSHGCMRVQNPDQYAATLLNIAMPDKSYTPTKVRSMYGRSEVNLNFPTPIPVNITYQTAFVDDAGKLQLRKDIYGRDAQMLALLKNVKSKNLEAVVAHSQPNYTRPTRLPDGVSVAGDYTGSSGASSNPFSFFENLFGGPQPRPQQPAARNQRRVYTR